MVPRGTMRYLRLPFVVVASCLVATSSLGFENFAGVAAKPRPVMERCKPNRPLLIPIAIAHRQTVVTHERTSVSMDRADPADAGPSYFGPIVRRRACAPKVIVVSADSGELSVRCGGEASGFRAVPQRAGAGAGGETTSVHEP